MSESKKLPEIENCEKFVATNWKQLSKKELNKLSLVQRSKYLAYEPPVNSTGINKSRQRLKEDLSRKINYEKEIHLSNIKWQEYQHQDYVMGQLKASEAQRRTKTLRGKYRLNRTNEINQLISTQPTAIKAVRLQSLLPPIPTKITFLDPVEERQRMRIEALMEDTLGIETGRILC